MICHTCHKKIEKGLPYFFNANDTLCLSCYLLNLQSQISQLYAMFDDLNKQMVLVLEKKETRLMRKLSQDEFDKFKGRLGVK